MKFFTRLWDGICDLLHDGGPSMTRVINFIVALTGAWLLYYTAKNDGDTGWPWICGFIAYLAYGAGPHVMKSYFDLLRAIKGSGNAQQQDQDPSTKPPKE